MNIKLELLQKVADGEIGVSEAYEKLFPNPLLPSKEEIDKEAISRFKGRNHVKWKSGIFRAGANWMKSVAYGCSDVVGDENYLNFKKNKLS